MLFDATCGSVNGKVMEVNSIESTWLCIRNWNIRSASSLIRYPIIRILNEWIHPIREN